MKLLVTSDWHLDAVTAGVKRSDEFLRYLDRMVEVIYERGVHFVAILGDYFDPGTMRAHELTARLFQIAGRLQESEAVDVLWLAGNHDVVENSEGWTTLSPLRTAFSVLSPDEDSARTHIFTKPRVEELVGPNGERLAALALPYVARAVEARDDYRGFLEGALNTAAKLSEVMPLVVLGHMTVPGAVLGSESIEMARGRDLDLPLERLAEIKPVFVANGHYHRAQTVRAGGIEVHIPGSPWRLTFGERDDVDKGFLVVEV